MCYNRRKGGFTMDDKLVINDVKEVAKWFLMGAVAGLEEGWVIDRNDIFTEWHKDSLELLGYNSFYDAYLDLYLNSEVIIKGGEKDLSKLNATKRTVIRNGKPVEITVYTKNGEEDKETKKNGSDDSGGNHAKSLPSTEERDPKKVQKIAKELTMKNGSSYGFKNTMTYYLIVRDKQGTPVAVVGYKEFGHYLKMVFLQTDGKVSGAGSRGFYEMVKKALPKKLGVMLDKNLSDSPFIAMYNMEKNKRGDYFLGYEDLVKVFGEVNE